MRCRLRAKGRHQSWAREPCGRKPQSGGTGFRHRGQGQEGCTQSPKATWLPLSLLPFSASAAWSACPSAWGTIAPAAQCFPSTDLLCLFLFFWQASSCWLSRVMVTAATLPFCTLLYFRFLSLIHAHHPDSPLSLPSHLTTVTLLPSTLKLPPSVQFSHSVVSYSLRPHGLQHGRLPCPSPTPGVSTSACPLSWWCHPTTSSSVIRFSSWLQSCPASGSFQVSHFFTWGGQRIGVSASASVLPQNTQDWSPLGWTGWISLHSKGLSRVFSNTTVRKQQFFST